MPGVGEVGSCRTLVEGTGITPSDGRSCPSQGAVAEGGPGMLLKFRCFP